MAVTTSDGRVGEAGRTASRGRGRGGGLTARQQRRARTGRLLVAPAIAFVLVFVVFPLGFAVYISLTNWPLLGSYHYVGTRNYSGMWHDPVFVHAFLFTLVFTAIVVVPTQFVGYLLAMFVRTRRPGSVLFRTLFFLPFVVGVTTEAYMLVLELQPTTGGADFLLHAVGLTSSSTAWLINTDLVILAACLLTIWFSAGLTMVLLMSAMQGISPDLYEAAELDGASRLRRELYITIPLLRRTLALTTLITTVGTFLTFNQFYVLTQGGPGTSTDTVIMWIYQTAFSRLHLGLASAMAVVVIVAVALVSLVQFLMLRKDD